MKEPVGGPRNGEPVQTMDPSAVVIPQAPAISSVVVPLAATEENEPGGAEGAYPRPPKHTIVPSLFFTPHR